jgi:hypothetical protein
MRGNRFRYQTAAAGDKNGKILLIRKETHLGEVVDLGKVSKCENGISFINHLEFYIDVGEFIKLIFNSFGSSNLVI